MSDMFKVFRKEIDWAGRKLVLETGKIAPPGRRRGVRNLWRHHGAAATQSCSRKAEARPLILLPADRQLPGKRRLPPTKSPGGFAWPRRRPSSEKEILTSRLIDRPIRPLFHESYRNETLVVVTTLAHDLEAIPASSPWSPRRRH